MKRRKKWDGKFVGCQSVFRIRSGGQVVPTGQSVTMGDGLNLREVGLDARTMIAAVWGYEDEVGLFDPAKGKRYE